MKTREGLIKITILIYLTLVSREPTGCRLDTLLHFYDIECCVILNSKILWKLMRNFNELNTFSNGCLGSHIDEERSEMRYVMRIAKPVSHQNFERNLHFLWGVCLLECLFIPTIIQISQDLEWWSRLHFPYGKCMSRWKTKVSFVLKLHCFGGDAFDECDVPVTWESHL